MPFNAVVVSGPSGVGKSTLCSRLLREHPGVLAATVSHTTRAPRAGEVDGKDYYFVSRETFEQMMADDAFIEHAEFNGNRYGTSKQTVRDQATKQCTVLLDIEMEGVKKLQALESSDVHYRYVFLQPPSSDELEARLRGRGTEDEESVQRRLARAREEIEFARTGVHDQIIVNRDLETAYRELKAFVFGEAKP